MNSELTAKTFEDILSESGSLLYRSRGVSMLPFIREGRDLLYIKKRPEGRLKKYDIVLFRRPGTDGKYEYVLHRIIRINPDGTYGINGDNCIGIETVCEGNIIGVLEALKRNGKTVRMTDLSSRLYVYLWCAPYRLRIFILKCLALFRGTAAKTAE